MQAHLAKAIDTALDREDAVRRTQHLHQVGLLASNIAHDLKNYAGVARGNLKLLGEELAEAGAGSGELVDALEAIGRVDVTARRLLALARDEDDAARRVPAADTIEESTRLLKHVARPDPARLPNDGCLDWIEVSPMDLESALLNLVTNATEATGGDDVPGVDPPGRSRG